MTGQIATGTRAPRWVSLWNPITSRLLSAGVPLGPNALLTVRGRKSGVPRATPLAIIEAGGRRWIWSPWGEVNWVRNLRAAGEATITVRGREEAVRPIELDPEQRLAFFHDVLRPVARSIRGGVAFVRLLDGVDVNRPAEAAQGRVVFELRSA
jgi:deazaflavin-dependent oxidoreductase (nitroreductase family)